MPTTLPAGGACNFTISYTAPASGTPTGAITFNDNAPHSNFASTPQGNSIYTQTLALSGTGASALPPVVQTTAPVAVNEPITVTDTPSSPDVSDQEVIKVTDTGTPSLPPAVTLVPSSLTFLAEFVGDSSSPQTVTMTNTGGASLDIFSISASGDFSQTNPCGTYLNAGANCNISVTFKPTAGDADRQPQFLLQCSRQPAKSRTQRNRSGLQYRLVLRFFHLGHHHARSNCNLHFKCRRSRGIVRDDLLYLHRGSLRVHLHGNAEPGHGGEYSERCHRHHYYNCPFDQRAALSTSPPDPAAIAGLERSVDACPDPCGNGWGDGTPESTRHEPMEVHHGPARCGIVADAGRMS